MMVCRMSEDLIEENNAANRLINHLVGKPIVNTSGNAEHQLKPISIEFKISLTEKGEELAISITQADRHHPHFVYDTIRKNLNEIEELKNYSLKPLQPEHDYDQQTGKMTVRYDLPSGTADSIIHSLSERSRQPLDSYTSLTKKPSSAIDKVIQYFSNENTNYRG